MEAEVEVAKVTCAFACADDSRSGELRVYLVEEEELYLGVDFDILVDEGGHVDVEGLDDDGAEDGAFFVSGGAGEGAGSGIVAAELVEG